MDIKAILNLMATPFEYAQDFFRAVRWSKASPLCPASKQLHYDILLLAHTVEKGLSVVEPRKGFGVSKITKLLSLLSEYDLNWGTFPVEKSYGCLKEYKDWHDSISFDLGGLGEKIDHFLDYCREKQVEPRGGVKSINLASMQPSVDYQSCLLNRFSCRRFVPTPISDESIDLMAKIAARTPSQCNRQSSRVHYYKDKVKIDELLRLQGGAEGFRENVYNLFLISSEISAWSGVKARSQAYVDGALTAMQVLNSCQSMGLGACPLNLAVTNRKEIKICEVGNIPKGERLIMMIAFGYPEKVNLVVARSERMGRDTLLVEH